MSRIVQVANFVTPSSGGLRTTLRHLASGYADAGHEVIQVLPGPADQDIETPSVRQILRHSPALPGTGYRVMRGGAALTPLLDRLEPDRIEVHDRTTLRGLGSWAAARGVPSLVVSHERTDRWLEQWVPHSLPLTSLADRYNAELAARFDVVLCTTAWAAAEFERLPTPHLVRVPLGVDLDGLHPQAADGVWRRHQLCGAEHLLILVSRLSREKRPLLALETVAELVRRGRSVRLLVAGSGPQQRMLQRRAHAWRFAGQPQRRQPPDPWRIAGRPPRPQLPVSFVGYVSERAQLARLLASADLLLAPGPVETFGLAALEALASGTSAIVNQASALPEVIGDSGGRCAEGRATAFADAVEQELAVAADLRRAGARTRAERFPWSATVAGFLNAHKLPLSAPTSTISANPVEQASGAQRSG